MTVTLPLAALLLAASPFQAEHPEVRAGNEALQGADPAAALPRYDAAERQAGPHAEIDFDRGHALLKAGRGDEARTAWKRSAERAPGPLASRALQNTASALDAAGDQAGAIQALGEALQRDPANEDARYNLEVLLRRKAEGKGAPRDPGDQGAKRPEGEPKPGAGGQQEQSQAGKQGKPPEPKPGEPKQDGQQQERKEEQPGRDAATGRAGDDQGKARDGAAGRPEPIGKQDAERLLDALRSRERTMPLGPVGPPTKERKGAAVTGRAILLAAALLLPALGQAAGMAITAALDREEIGLDELVTLEVRVEAGEAPTVSLPTQGFDFDVVSRGSSRSTSINMGGGGGMKVQHTFVFQFGLRPRHAGDLTVPAVEVVAGQARGETQPLSVKVLPAGSASRQPARPAPPLFGFPGGGGGPGGGSSRAWHGWERDLQLSVEVDKTEAFLGEQVTASVWVLSPVGVAETGNFKPPAYDGFWTEQLELPREPVQQIRKKDGLPLRAYLLQRLALFPTRAGTLELEPHAIDLVVRVASDDPFYPFGDVQRVTRVSKAVAITVKPLPRGAPARFDQANVGEATLTATLAPKSATVGQPVTLRLVAEGEGNVKAWGLPALPAVPGARAFAPTSSDQLKPRGVKLAGSRTVETVLVPETPGALVIPPLHWTIFDPKAGAYRELKTPELRVEVSGGPAVAGGVPAQNTLYPGLRPIRPAGPLVRAAAPGTRWALWAFLLGPVAAFLTLTGLDRLRERRLAGGGARRGRLAGRVARQRLAGASRLASGAEGAPFFAEVERALTGYCADKLGRPAAGLTRDELARSLGEAGAHVAALRALADALDACDAGRFGGAVARDELLALAGRAMELLEESHWRLPGGDR